MRTLDEQILSVFSTNLIEEVRSIINPNKLNFLITEELPSILDAQLTEDENGDFTILLRDGLIEDYTLSHEVLHILAKKVVPLSIKVLETDLLSMISGQLRGYLEHNWILAEQRKRGLEIDVFSLWGDIKDTIGQDQEGIDNFRRIMILSNLIRTFPEVFEKNYEFFKINNPVSLCYAEKIMAHYPKKEILSPFEARRATVRAINEWKDIFTTCGLIANHLTYQISVTPVFSQNQLDKLANLTLGLIPNAYTSNDEKESYHLIHALSDNQCCIIFQTDEDHIQLITIDMNRLTLAEFLKRFPLNFLMR